MVIAEYHLAAKDIIDDCSGFEWIFQGNFYGKCFEFPSCNYC